MSRLNKEAATQAQKGIYAEKYTIIPRNIWRSWIFLGASRFKMAETFSMCVDNPRHDTFCPSNSNDWYAKWHFVVARVIPVLVTALNTWSRWSKWSSKVLEKMTISSIYTSAKIHKNGANTFCMTLWKIDGPFLYPKGIRMNCHKPWWVLKANFSLSLGSTSNCINLASAVTRWNGFQQGTYINLAGHWIFCNPKWYWLSKTTNLVRNLQIINPNDTYSERSY